jgi:N-formylglutamate amidohydrolase
MSIFDLHAGDSPLLLSVPHAGTDMPSDLAERLTPVGRTLLDTDWEVDRLYPFARELGMTVLRANVSRYVVDLNRDPADAPLYPGARTTTVCPTESFEGDPLYERGENPARGEIALRVFTYWQPYHDALAAEIARIRERHGYAIVIDGHSIWGRLPLLFEGELPDVNIGTNRGASCAPWVTETVSAPLAERYPGLALDGRFTGGYITRHYGKPDENVHAIQIELNQRTYIMDGTRTSVDLLKAATLSAGLRAACAGLIARVT